MPEGGFQLLKRSTGGSVWQNLRRQLPGAALSFLCVLVAERTLSLDRCVYMDSIGANTMARLFSAGVLNNATYYTKILLRRITQPPTALTKIERSEFSLLERFGVLAPDGKVGPLVKVMNPQSWSTVAPADAAAVFVVTCTYTALCLDAAGTISLPWETMYSPFCIFGVIVFMCCLIFRFVRFKNDDDTEPYVNQLGCLVARICILGNLAVFTMKATCIFMIMMWQYVGGPLLIDEYYKVFRKIDNGRNVKTPLPPTRFEPYEKGTTDEEAKEAGFDQEAPPFDPSKVVVDDDDPSKLDFQFETEEQGWMSSFLSKMKGAFKGHVARIKELKHFFTRAEADEERASGSVELPSNERRRRDVVRRMTARWREGACATHWSTSTQADIEAQGVAWYFEMRCFRFEGMTAWLRERLGLCEALLDRTQKIIAKPKPAEGEKVWMVLDVFLPCFDPFKPLPLLLFTEVLPPYKMIYWSSLAKTLAVLKATRATGMYLLLTLLDTLRYDWKLRVPQNYLSADGKRWNLNTLKIREAAPKFLILFIWSLWWILRLFWLSLFRGFGFRVQARRPRNCLELSDAIDTTLISARWRGG
jgi:hypothetical protein